MIVEGNLFYWLTLVLKIMLIIILFELFRIYLDSYKKIKIGYTIGLLLFSSILLFFSIVSFIFVLSSLIIPLNENFPSYTNNMFVETLIQLIAMGILYKITKDE
ncbi:hypothetical protein [Methanobrevibacter sp. DSM 116169]|uniref:hypothetical protein n=1 Tax=Methanobrevibacter sp. DSM 116169 TaxID=3242727 RepID=UPI0038FBE5CB